MLIIRTLVRSFVCTLLASSAMAAGMEDERQPLPKFTVRAPVQDQRAADLAGLPSQRLVVKFSDDLRVRSDGQGGLVGQTGDLPAALLAVCTAFGAESTPLIDLDPLRLLALEERAARRSGREQPDLGGLFIVRPFGRDDVSSALLETFGNELLACSAVEFAHIESLLVPPPDDLPPTTPDLVFEQDYRGPDPGLNFDAAWTRGARGAFVTLADCEYGWRTLHEDFCGVDIVPEAGQTVAPAVINFGWHEHGTAALGVSVAGLNGYGMSGTVPDARARIYTEWSVEQGLRRVAAITSAIADVGAGDVVLLEMQANGAGGGFGPAELDPAVWMLTRMGSDAGVVVVAAAGNGAQDLDGPAYASYRALGDSGAVIVGSGTPNTLHAKVSSSTFGTRVNVQAWGFSVATLGYGNLAVYGGDPNQSYTQSFSGTSSASAIVAGAAVAVQSYLLQGGCDPLAPEDLRALLVSTGVPQGGGAGSIGPMPDLAAALDALQTCSPGTAYCPTANNSTGAAALLDASGTSSVSVGSLALRAAPVPPTSGLFFYGTRTTLSPFGDGFRCVGGSVQRFPVQTAAPDFALSVPFATEPNLSAGSTWHFQCWFRDPAAVGAGFNLSTARSFTLTP